MILFKDKKFSNYIDLLYFLIDHNMKVRTDYFPNSNLYYCKVALENKFKRKFKLKEVRELIKDMPKVLTPSEHSKEGFVVHANSSLTPITNTKYQMNNG